MNCKVHFYLLNDDFSVEHAEANHEGKESENNRLHEWEDELDITTEVTGMEMHEGASFPLQGQHPDGKDFHFDIKGMRLFELLGEQKTVLGCSESLFDSDVELFIVVLPPRNVSVMFNVFFILFTESEYDDDLD